MASVLTFLLDLLLGSRCTCGARGGGCPCSACRRALVRSPTLLGAAFADHEPAASLVRAAKFGRWRGGARVLAQHLVQRLDPVIRDDVVAVTWVPCEPRRARRRGVDLPRAVARAAADVLGVPAIELLVRTGSRPQRGLDADERVDNARSSFDVHPRAASRAAPLRGGQGSVLLLDDICTTGATLGACSALASVALAAIHHVRVVPHAIAAVPAQAPRATGVLNSRSLRGKCSKENRLQCR